MYGLPRRGAGAKRRALRPKVPFAMKSHAFLFLCFIAAVAAPQPGSSAASAPVTPAVSVETLKSVVQTLASDEYEGRAPATQGEVKSIAYIAERFRAAGLAPGNQGNWMQPVPLVEIDTSPTSLTISGGKQPLQFGYRADMVAATYQVRPKVEVKDSDIVFVGYGINAPERGWNDYAGVDVRGKTVVILVNDPDYQMRGLDGPFEGRAMTYYGRWTYKYEEAARQGAAAAFIVHDTEPAAYGWNVVQSSWTGPQYEMDDVRDHMDQSKVIGWLTNDAARRLFANAGRDLDTLSSAAKQPGFKAVPLGMKAGIGLSNRIRRQASNNVVGILKGRTRPDEYVLYTAHWDHLGRCDAAADGDDICNGAIDNGTGVGALVALAEAHVKTGPAARSIVFLAVTAEESGLLGSKYYAEHPIYPLAKTVGGVNMDALNMAGPTRDIAIIGAGKSQLDEHVKRAVAAQGRVVAPEPNPERGSYFRSDHFSLARGGVPMASFAAGDDLLKGGRAAGAAARADYIAHRYHGPKDEYDPSWDWTGVIQDIGLFYAVGRELAEGGDWPDWSPTAEFRAIRDKSRGSR